MEPIKNPVIEKLAAKIATNWDKRNEIYTSFILKNPDLKRWEAAAIADRARFLHNKLIIDEEIRISYLEGLKTLT